MMTPEERKLLEAKAEKYHATFGQGAYMKGAEAALELRAEREAKLTKVLSKAFAAVHRLKIGVQWRENPEWFDEVYQEAEQALAECRAKGDG